MTCIVPPSPPWSGAALLRFCEPRFESIGNTFITFPTCYHADFVAKAGASRRSRSFSHVSLEHVEMQASLSSGESGESTDAAEAHDGTSGTEDTEDGGCTMMLRNIPHGVEQTQLLQKLRDCGFGGELEFVYLPMMFGKRRPVGRGFAFVGLKSRAATKLTESWHQANVFGERPLNVATAHVQGLEANMKHWERSKTKRIQNSRYRPWTADMERDN